MYLRVNTQKLKSEFILPMRCFNFRHPLHNMQKYHFLDKCEFNIFLLLGCDYANRRLYIVNLKFGCFDFEEEILGGMIVGYFEGASEIGIESDVSL